MATVQQQKNKNVKPAVMPATAPVVPAKAPEQRKPAKAAKTHVEYTLLFDKENYMWMIGGVALIVLGMFLMAGGKSANPHEFHYDEIYSFRRITLAPIIMLIGFGIEAYAIMKLPKQAVLGEEKV